MKRLILIFILILVILPGGFSQAKKPTIMVVPSDVWCNQNGYMTEFNNQGTIMKIPDYTRALQESTDLKVVISKINIMMTDRGFPLADLEGRLKTLQSEAAEDAMLTNSSGEEVSETPIDKLKKVANADIWMQLTWTINQSGPQKSVTFILQGIDAYTDKQIAGATGTGEPSFTAPIPVLLEEAVLAHIDNFNLQLLSHFDDLFANGREVILRIKRWGSFEGDLESEYDGYELGEIIENWVSDNTVENRFNTAQATENMMLFEQVRIPLYDENNKATDARRWARGLARELKDKYAIESKLMMKGLGQASLVIGEK
jgi:hypothetical protein